MDRAYLRLSIIATSTERAAEFSFAVLTLLYAIFSMSIPSAPLQDLPNHLTRAHIISDLLFNGGAIFGKSFKFEPFWCPYLVGDLVLAVLDWSLGAEWAARLWTAAAVLVLPFSAVFALRVQGASRVAAMTGGIVAFYTATDWFFTTGFLNYQLASASALFTFGWYLRARDRNDRKSYCWYLLILFASYLLHLSALVFIIALVGTSATLSVLRRTLSVQRAMILLAAPLLLFVVHFLLVPNVTIGTYPTSWGTWQTKLLFLVSPAVRFATQPELALLISFIAVSMLPLTVGSGTTLATCAEQLLLAAVCVALYLVIPSYTGNVFSVDVRALPYALVFLVFAGAIASDRSPNLRTAQLILASLLASINLGYLAFEVLPQNEAMERYKAIASAVPNGANVLPIDARPPIGRYRPFVHAGSYATLRQAAISPYLFAADSNPPMPYFRYVHREYAPDQFWYEKNIPRLTPDWNKVMQSYQYILITVPWDAARIPVPCTIIERNDVAALLKVSTARGPR